MSKNNGPRALSPEFIRDLQKNGLLNPLLERVTRDTSLDMEIRQDYLNVYYRGGNLLRVCRENGKGDYTFFFDTRYAAKSKCDDFDEIPARLVSNAENVRLWLDWIPTLKDTMDLWFGKNPKDERASQQMVVRENNASAWAGGTDYFIIDIEYDNRKGARFDLVALYWESGQTARKLQKGYLPKLAVIEMKTGDGAIRGKSGLVGHYRQWCQFLGDKTKADAFKEEMLQLLRQKRLLKLIPALSKNRNEITKMAESVETIFLLANHDPESSKLTKALDDLQEERTKCTPGFEPLFATGTFMGFGLYKEAMHPLEVFRSRLTK